MYSGFRCGYYFTTPPFPQQTFIYNIYSPKTCREIQQKYNCKLPVPLTYSQLSTTSSSLHPSLPTPSPTSTNTSSSKKQWSCSNFLKVFQKLKSNFKSKPKPPPAPSPIPSTFNYELQFKKIVHHDTWDIQVPAFLDVLAIFFQDEGFLKQKGIFRLSSNLEELRNFINKFKNADEKTLQEVKNNKDILSQYHLEPCDALKRWLRELPRKLFNQNMNKNLEDIAKMGITEDSMEILRALVFQLDVSRQNILKYILQVSHQVLKYTDSNCMDEQCLARTIGPNLFSLEASSIHSFNWSMDIFKLLLSKDVDYWFTLPILE